MGRGKAEPRSLRTVLTGVMQSLGLDDPAEAALRARWDQAVGSEIAAVCRVEKLDAGRLYLGVDNPVWSYELSMRREALRGKINAFLGEEKVIEVHVRLKNERRGAGGQGDRTHGRQA